MWPLRRTRGQSTIQRAGELVSAFSSAAAVPLPRMSVMLETSLGELVIDLEVERCPRTCENFLKLCKIKYYALNAFFNGSSILLGTVPGYLHLLPFIPYGWRFMLLRVLGGSQRRLTSLSVEGLHRANRRPDSDGYRRRIPLLLPPLPLPIVITSFIPLLHTRDLQQAQAHPQGDRVHGCLAH